MSKPIEMTITHMFLEMPKGATLTRETAEVFHVTRNRASLDFVWVVRFPTGQGKGAITVAVEDTQRGAAESAYRYHTNPKEELR